MKPPLTLYLVGLFVILVFGVTQTKAQANLAPDDPAPEVEECQECHLDIYVAWEDSTHGKGLSCGQCHLGNQDNHAREGHWTQGGPQECMGCHTTGYDPETDTWEEGNIHCIVCHSPIEPEHPDKPIPTNRSAELCGKCHIEAHFEWETSAHGQSDVTCVSCHSQHTTSLKSGSIIEQCHNCHETVANGFLESIHGEEGLTCADCHLATFQGPIASGLSKRSHTFTVYIETCVACHGETLHSANEESLHQVFDPYGHKQKPDPMVSNISTTVTEEPAKASPLGFLALGSAATGFTIGGLGIGFALAVLAWANQLHGRFRRRGQRG